MRNVSIHIPQPCHERWADMQPADRGRLCASCQKVVVDYTACSDQELAKQLGQATEPSCGRFRPQQLNRPLKVIESNSAPAWRHWLNLITVGLFGWQTVRAQVSPARPAKPPVSTRPVYWATRLPVHQVIQPDTNRVIRGRVLFRDSSGNLSPFSKSQITISRSGESWETQTDTTGAFSVSITTQRPITELDIQALTSDSRYSQTTLGVDPFGSPLVLGDIILPEPMELVEITVVAGEVTLAKQPSRWQKLKRRLLR